MSTDIKSILVVDDEEGLRKMVSMALTKAGYSVVTSHSGPDALAKVTQEHFDAVVSDVRMPEMSGFDLMHTLSRMCEDSVLILLTAVPDPDMKLTELAKMSGVYAYLNKPCKLDVLKETLAAAFAEQELSREAFLSLDDLNEDEVSSLSNMISRATKHAVSGIASMVGSDVSITTAEPRQISASKAGELLKNPEGILIGINMEIDGDTTGNMLLLYPPQVAYGLTDMLMGNPLGTTTILEETGESALKEMGNLAGGFFLNSLGNATSMSLFPTPPILIMGKAERVLDNAFRPLANANAKVFVIQTVFETSSGRISGYFLTLSTPKLMNALVNKITQGETVVS